MKERQIKAGAKLEKQVLFFKKIGKLFIKKLQIFKSLGWLTPKA